MKISRSVKKILTKGHGVTSQRAWLFNNTAVRNWNVEQHADCSVRTNTGEPVKTLTTSTDLVNKLYRHDFEFYANAEFFRGSPIPHSHGKGIVLWLTATVTWQRKKEKLKAYRGVKVDNQEFLILVLGIVTSGPLQSLTSLTLILLMWRIWWAPNNASKWQMGFNSGFKGLTKVPTAVPG
jgi:hypothetical protein